MLNCQVSFFVFNNVQNKHLIWGLEQEKLYYFPELKPLRHFKNIIRMCKRSQFKNSANLKLTTFLQKARSSLKYESVQSGLLNKWAGHMRVIMYSFETHLTKERSNYLIIISWRVQRSTCASADSPNITFDILTRFRNISFYRSYFKNGLT